MGSILSPVPQSRLGFLDYFKSNIRFAIGLHGNPYDRGPAHYSGTVSGALVSNGDELRRSCYWFDGSNDRIDFGTATLFPAAASHSFFAIVKPESTANGGRIIEYSRGATQMYVQCSWSGAYFAVATYGVSGWVTVYSNITRPCFVGQWYLLSYSYDHSAAITRCFINGRLYGTAANDRATGYTGSYNGYIGGNANNAAAQYQWAGKISEVGCLSRKTADWEHLDYYRFSCPQAPRKKIFLAGYAEDAVGGSAVPVFQSNYSRRRRAA
jgi:hypothetical protein